MNWNTIAVGYDKSQSRTAEMGVQGLQTDVAGYAGVVQARMRS